MIALLGGVRATIFAGVAVAALAFGGWQVAAKNVYKNKLEKQDTEHKTLVYNLLLNDLNSKSELSKSYAQNLKDADAKRVDVTRKLRTAEYKLRQHWTCPREDTSGAEEAARLREEDTGNLVGIGAEADAQVKGLIEANENLERTIEALLRSR